MPGEVDPTLLKSIWQILKYLVPTSIVGVIALYTAWITLPPKLMIESISDKSKNLNTQSKIVIKNSGIITAYAVTAESSNVHAEINTNTISIGSIIGGPHLAGKLSGGESTEIPITPGINVQWNTGFDKFSYILTLNYHAKILGFKKEFSRSWKIKLSVFSDGFNWNVTII